MEAKPGLFSGLSLRRPTPTGTIAHPLLGATSPESDGERELKELPYKPRQRAPSPASPGRVANDSSSAQLQPAPPAITTSTVASFAPEEAGAAGRLQLQSLKAAAQRIGLSNGSMGMGMVDSIFEKGSRARADGDWADLLKALTTGKAIILLPSSPASSLPMTPQTLRDHIAFLSPALPTPSGPASVLVTLSGLVGSLQSGTVTFESCVPPDSSLLHALRNEDHRAGVLSRLRPTHLAAPPLPSLPSPYPPFTLAPESTSLSFPPLGRGAPEKRPDPRRYPFMSLFGSSPSTPRTTGALTPDRPASPNASGRTSPRPSVMSLEDEHGEGYSVAAYVVDRGIRYTEVHKALVKAVRGVVRAELEGLPDRVVDKVLRFVTGSVCPVSGGVDGALLKAHHLGLGAGDSDVPLDFSNSTVAGERSQDFMEGVYDDLVQHFRAEGPKKWENDEDAHEGYIEDEAGDGTERVEALVCRLLHNRIFSPLNSDDARHDEALASRIAALNMLDLSLDHLGLITRPPGETDKGALGRGLAALVDDVGGELQKLSRADCLTPKDKVDVLVNAHKIAVDGLALLPPIQLRPEGEPYIPEGLDAINEVEPLASRLSDPDDDGTELAEAGTPGAPTRETAKKDGYDSDEKAVDSAEDVNADATDEKVAVAEPEKKTPPATSGADLILPLIIFAVVKANPAQLASQLMYLRRYRSAICLAGEASYAIVNLTAVVEFLEHVQLSELGLESTERVMSVADLAPISLGDMDDASISSASSRIKGRLLPDIAGSAADGATRVLGAVEGGISVLRGLMAAQEEEKPQGRPRQSSTFSLASVTASVANIAAAASTAAARTRSRASSEVGQVGRELLEVPPGTLSDEEVHDGVRVTSPIEEEEEERDGRARSIVSVSSMMRDTSRERVREGVGARLSSLGARLAEGGPTPTPTPMSSEKPASSVVPPGAGKDGFFATLSKRRPPRSPSGTLLAPDDGPIERFMTCEVGDIRLNEVGTLLRDYRRLAGVVSRLQGQ
ncbi:hypothetical protein CcaverHIS002_0205690 [Cutaneotrichosporon cavernicola]|nr:hypothetical protein CcaverHIS002_0205690 [Cutaneotrichosporon cavernicola]BEI96980.1 hypothetical protein CcaverHIS631_0205690 [Cutaneotrichosporon cavernicola]BEJ04754.1 hypothetical protein CcaverHIS641_0205710 [Cutaneotrichosporon cavernicola]